MNTKSIIDFFMLRIKKKTLIFNIRLTAWIIAAFAILSFIIDLINYDPAYFINNIIGTGVLLFFAFGFYIKSRIISCLLVFFHLLDVISDIINPISTDNVAWFIFKILFLVIIIRGTKAIFIYHKFVKKAVKKANLDKTL